MKKTHTTAADCSKKTVLFRKKSGVSAKTAVLILAVGFLIFSCKTPEVIQEPVFELPAVVIPEKEEPVVYRITVQGAVPVIADEDELNELIKLRALEYYLYFENAAAKTGVLFEETADLNEENIRDLKFAVSWKAGRRDYDYVSIVITAAWQNGSENMSVTESFTWNVKSKKILSVSDVLPFTGFDSLESLSAYAAQNLRDQLNSGKTDAGNELMILCETAPTEENYSIFLLEKDGVTFYFAGGELQPANGAAGSRTRTQTVKITKLSS
jgi:hypothetical protein